MSDLPTSFVDGLRQAANFLDLGDQMASILAEARGIDYVPGSSVQDDLRSVALWLVDHPTATLSEIDAYFMSLIGGAA